MAELQLLIEQDKANADSEEKRQNAEFSEGKHKKEGNAYSKLTLRRPLIMNLNGRNSNRKLESCCELPAAAGLPFLTHGSKDFINMRHNRDGMHLPRRLLEFEIKIVDFVNASFVKAVRGEKHTLKKLGLAHEHERFGAEILQCETKFMICDTSWFKMLSFRKITSSVSPGVRVIVCLVQGHALLWLASSREWRFAKMSRFLRIAI
ncbi:hypothetical protein Tco_0598361 [Tanacetum coccineum]